MYSSQRIFSYIAFLPTFSSLVYPKMQYNLYAEIADQCDDWTATHNV
ncbi:hypothetical protein SAMN05660862_0935 [Sphingobacterium psychroaquaticum]|uniref:Uncharacterized protein n=1 Tax=Sphingobacterium psychroaquaticum TaxID=561061 RepID=A0A1X7IL64_9SPHI|nr:hypothetical protein SAMN05660862_0935 [Sphingobacterium psychroaquaticum]